MTHTSLPPLPQHLDRTVVIEAPREIVFRVFTDETRWASWWGAGSTIDSKPGGKLRIRYPDGTEVSGEVLEFRHDFAEASVRDQHVQGWRYQLSLFGNIVASELHGNAAAAVDEWFAAWIDQDGDARRQRLSAIVTSNVRFRDRFSLIDGLDELNAQVGAVQRFMPGLRMERRGNVRQCQGLVLAEWIALSTDNQERGRGTNVFAFGPDNKIEAVTGFWAP